MDAQVTQPPTIRKGGRKTKRKAGRRRARRGRDTAPGNDYKWSHPPAPLRLRDREVEQQRNSPGRDDKVRRIEDDVKNKRSVFTTVWNWTASPREKWGSPTVPGKWYCVLRGCIAKTTRQRGGGDGGGCGGPPLAWIYSAQDATATWYLLSAGRLPTNASVIKPRECSHYCALRSHTTSFTLYTALCTRNIVLQITPSTFPRGISGKMKYVFVACAMLFNLPVHVSNLCSYIRREDRYWLSSKL